MKILRKENTTAYTLVEITMTMVILAVLATLALPRFSIAIERMRTREGITALQAIRASWKEYELNTGASTTNLTDLDIVVSGMKNFTSLDVNGASTATLLANCSSSPCLNSDAWVATATSTGKISWPLHINIDGTIVCGDSGDSSFDAICNNVNIPIQIP